MWTFMTSAPLFRTELDNPVCALPLPEYQRLLDSAISEFSISELQQVELGAFAFSMVVRTALGLSAEGAALVCVVRDCLSGLVTLAAARQLLGAGASPVVLIRGTIPDSDATCFCRLASSLDTQGVPLVAWNEPKQNDEIAALIESTHAVLIGCFDHRVDSIQDESDLCSICNELSTPCHAVMLPPGIHPIDGGASGSALFASSTLSLGTPLDATAKCSDYLGRHYIGDISLPASRIADHGGNSTLWFARQPVIQIYPAS